MKNVNLVDVVADRIKGSALGELIDDADLYDIVKQGIEKAFFEKRAVTEGWNTKHLPPLITETIQAAFKDALRPHIDRYIAEHAEDIAAHLKAATERGFISVGEELAAAKTRAAIAPVFNETMRLLKLRRPNADNGHRPVH